jgi:hypothetical protein
VNIALIRRLPIALALLLFTMLAAGCAVTQGYGDGGGFAPGIGAGYYEPFGFEVGGWGQDYHSGPFRGGDFRRGGHSDHFGHGGRPAFRPAPASHSVPFIPMGHSHSRGRR